MSSNDWCEKDPIAWYYLKTLEMKRDVLVRRLRTERDYKLRCQMNNALDALIDEIVRIKGDSDETSDRG